MSKIADAIHRLMDQARGLSGFIVLESLDENEGMSEMSEHVLVRRSDLQALLATWWEEEA